MRVKKGEVVVRFDTDKIRRGVAEQEIKYQTADGKAKQAKEEMDVQKNKAESEIAKAKLTLDLAKLDRVKYLEGDYKVEVDDKKAPSTWPSASSRKWRRSLRASAPLSRKALARRRW